MDPDPGDRPPAADHRDAPSPEVNPFARPRQPPEPVRIRWDQLGLLGAFAIYWFVGWGACSGLFGQRAAMPAWIACQAAAFLGMALAFVARVTAARSAEASAIEGGCYWWALWTLNLLAMLLLTFLFLGFARSVH
jgi:hypothetical protein